MISYGICVSLNVRVCISGHFFQPLAYRQVLLIVMFSELLDVQPFSQPGVFTHYFAVPGEPKPGWDERGGAWSVGLSLAWVTHPL